MASLKIEERFVLPAPPDEVFDYLRDPERVAVCLPGASLDGANEDGSWSGAIRVKIGAVSMAYRGTMRFLEVDERTRRVLLEGKGRERAGDGSVQMTMEGVVSSADGGSEVVLKSTVRLSGRIVRFARGMIQGVSREIFRQFTACVGKAMAAEESSQPRDAAVPAEVGALGLMWTALRSWVKRLLGGER